MKRQFWILCFGVFAIATPAWSAGIVKAGLGFGAKEMCSCLFVMESSLKDCKTYVDTGVPLPIRFSRKDNVVTSRLFGVFRRRAQYEGKRKGCRLL